MLTNDNTTNATATNQKNIDDLTARLLRSAENTQNCFEESRALIRTCINALCLDEVTEDDMGCIVKLLLQAELYNEIGYSRYLIETAKA